MEWKDVGGWLKDNAGAGAALVGSLLTGNVPGAVAAGVSLVAGATGATSPQQALEAFQTNPATVVRLRELAVEEAKSIRDHIAAMELFRLTDIQKEHETTQGTVQAGDRAEDTFVRRTRPGQSWLGLVSALAYVFLNQSPDPAILTLLLSLPWAYMGLRQVDKSMPFLTRK